MNDFFSFQISNLKFIGLQVYSSIKFITKSHKMKRTFVALSNTYKNNRFATLLKFATVTHVEKSYENPLICKKSQLGFTEKINDWIKNKNVNVLDIKVDQGCSYHENYYAAYITYTTSFSWSLSSDCVPNSIKADLDFWKSIEDMK